MVSNSFLNEHRNETFAFWTPSVKEFKWWHGEPVCAKYVLSSCQHKVQILKKAVANSMTYFFELNGFNETLANSLSKIFKVFRIRLFSSF